MLKLLFACFIVLAIGAIAIDATDIDGVCPIKAEFSRPNTGRPLNMIKSESHIAPAPTAVPTPAACHSSFTIDTVTMVSATKQTPILGPSPEHVLSVAKPKKEPKTAKREIGKMDNVKQESVEAPLAQAKTVKGDPVKLEQAKKEPAGKQPAKEERAKEQQPKKRSTKEDPGQVKSPKVEQAKPELIKIKQHDEIQQIKLESVKGVPVKSEPVKVKSVKVEPLKDEPVKVEPVKDEPVKREPLKREQVKREQVKGEPVKVEPVKSEPVKGEPVKSEPVEGDPFKDESAKADYEKLILETKYTKERILREIENEEKIKLELLRLEKAIIALAEEEAAEELKHMVPIKMSVHRNLKDKKCGSYSDVFKPKYDELANYPRTFRVKSELSKGKRGEVRYIKKIPDALAREPSQ